MRSLAAAVLVTALATPTAARAVAPAAPLDPDALSARYRGWHYYPSYVIPPVCLNRATCPTNTSQQCVDVFTLWTTPDAPDVWRSVYTQFDGTGYETYMATSFDMVNFDLANPTLATGQPGVVYSPRPGRVPIDGYKAHVDEFDFGGVTFIGPLLVNYTVGARATLRADSKGRFWYAYGAYAGTGYENLGSDGMAFSADGVNWVRATPTAIMDTLPSRGAQPWEMGNVYAPFLIPAPDGTLADFYNAGSKAGDEQSGAAYLAGGVEDLPGYDFSINASLWVRDPSNPTLTHDANATYQSSDPKVFWDAEQGVWVLFYFCNGAGTGGGANICFAVSTDQRSWQKAHTPLYVHGGHPRGLDALHAHKVWLTSDGAGRLFMYYTCVNNAGRGICLLTSSPLPS